MMNNEVKSNSPLGGRGVGQIEYVNIYGRNLKGSTLAI